MPQMLSVEINLNCTWI